MAEQLSGLAPKALAWVKHAVYEGVELDQTRLGVRGVFVRPVLFHE